MLNTVSSPIQSLMVVTDKAFYVQLGRRIADARKARGMTQTQLAEALGIAQQTMAHYEGGRLRLAVALLPPLARTLDVSIEALIGEPVPPAKRGPTPKLQQQIERLHRLPRATQKVVMEMLDGVLSQAGRA